MKIRGNGRFTLLHLKICSIFILLLTVITAGCGKDAVKPSEDSIVAQGALHSLERLREAYEAKDLDPVKDLAAPELVSRLERGFHFDKARLSYSTPRVIKITGTHVTVSINWQGEWEVGGVVKKDRGTSRFVFLRDSMQMVDIEGDNPFAMPQM